MGLSVWGIVWGGERGSGKLRRTGELERGGKIIEWREEGREAGQREVGGQMDRWMDEINEWIDRRAVPDQAWVDDGRSGEEGGFWNNTYTGWSTTLLAGSFSCCLSPEKWTIHLFAHLSFLGLLAVSASSMFGPESVLLDWAVAWTGNNFCALL
jgi:hypothetical protein